MDVDSARSRQNFLSPRGPSMSRTSQPTPTFNQFNMSSTFEQPYYTTIRWSEQDRTRGNWPLAITPIRMTWEVRSDLYETMMNKMEMELEDTQSFVSEMSTTAAEEDSGIPTGDNVQSNRLEREEEIQRESRTLKFDLKLSDGCFLPKEYLPYPPDLTNVPVDDIDPVRRNQDQTFVVITEKMGRLVISRYGTGNSLCVIPPTSILRAGCIFILSNQWFEVFITISILLNGFFLGIESEVYFVECGFLFMYTAEMTMNIIARGFIIGRKCYLHDIWNIIDFGIIVFSYVYFVYELIGKEDEFRINLQALRAIRILRTFKTLSSIEGLRKIMNALLKSVRNLLEVLLLSLFLVFVTAVVGIQVFGGMLRNKCVKMGYSESNYDKWIHNPNNYFRDNFTNEPVVCSNATYRSKCPEERYECIKVGINPNEDSTSFDWIGPSMLVTFQVFHLDYWENIYNMLTRAAGFQAIVFFLPVVLFGSFYLMNLMLAVVTKAYEEEVEDSQMELRQRIEAEEKEREEELKKLFEDPYRLHEFWSCPKCSKKKRVCCCCRTRKKLTIALSCQKLLYKIVTNDIFEITVTLIILTNTIFLAFDQYPEKWQTTIVWANSIFTSFFLMECILKVLAMGRYYFLDAWNQFDFAIVIASVVEIIVHDVLVFVSGEKESQGLEFLTVFRVVRLFRVFKLARSWPAMRILLQITFTTIKDLAGLVIMLAVVIYIFAVIGLKLLSEGYTEEKWAEKGKPVPRWNFSDFFHSFMIVFRILCGEWIESVTECMEVNEPGVCLLVYLSTLLVGNFLVMNLFLAMLLNKFGQEDLIKMQHQAETQTTKKKNKFLICLSKLRKKKLKVEKEKRCDCNPNAHKCERFARFQSKLRAFVEHKVFVMVILVVIVWSTITLTLDDVYLKLPKEKAWREPLIDCTNVFLAIIFFVEFLLKFLAWGPKDYFIDGWNLLDFIIMLATVVDAIITGEKIRQRHLPGENVLEGSDTETAVTFLRFLRALRPLRAIQQWESTRIIVNSFIKSIPQILNVLLVCFIFWLTFAIMGVNLMKGKFSACYYLETNERVPLRTEAFPVMNKQICLANPQVFVWRNYPINFDNTGTALLALLQVATFEGWMEVMQHAVDMPDDFEQQPSRENQLSLYYFFFVFIICGAFFTLNLFIGVIIDNFNSVKESISHDSYRDKAFSENQAKFLKTIKRVLRKRPKVKTVASNFVLGKLFHAVVHRLSFDLIIPVFIFLDLLSQAFREAEMSDTRKEILFHLNVGFTSFYFWEFIIRLVAMRRHVGKDVYIIDFASLTISIIGIVVYFWGLMDMDFAFIRFLRIYRIGRAFKQFKYSSATRIRKLLLAFVKSGTSLITICLLMFIFLIIFALIGMKLFRDISFQKAINDRVNFQTMINSMFLLFRLLTIGGWNDVLDSLMSDEDEDICNEGGQCFGNGVAIFYFVAYVIVMFLVIVNMYVAVILKYFDLADDQEQIGITEDDYEIFLSQWQHIDPKAQHCISYSQLSDFVAHIKGPLQIGKPNSVKLINLQIPLTFQDRVHVVHVFEALLAHFLKPIDLTTPAFWNALRERHESLKNHFLNFNTEYPSPYTSEERFIASRAYTALQRAYINYKFAAALRSVANPKLAIKVRKEIEDCMLL